MPRPLERPDKPRSSYRFRRNPRQSDVAEIGQLVKVVGLFSREEQRMAVGMMRERLRIGRGSGYSFLFAMLEDRVVAYTAYGRIPATSGRYDLYWIAVHPGHQGLGLGTDVLTRTEKIIAHRDGHAVYIETSSRAAYENTRRFYEHRGYRQCARLPAYYGPGDDKIVYSKRLLAEAISTSPSPRCRGGPSPCIRRTGSRD